MRKLILTLALAATAGNLAGAAYAAICQGVNGGRSCGEVCTGMADGGCGCKGTCSAAEMEWVDGASKPKSAEAEEEMLAN